MWHTKPFMRAASSVAVRSVLLVAFGATALLVPHASALAGDDVLQALKPVTDAMLAKAGAGRLVDAARQLSRMGL